MGPLGPLLLLWAAALSARGQEPAFRFNSEPAEPADEAWQPLRATFRPLNRAEASTEAPEAASSAAPALAAFSADQDELPTRLPSNRFRPSKAPSLDEAAQLGAGQPQPAGARPANASLAGAYQISADCFECICEASTGCNPQSRCQTSDVRHTRCGLFLLSYDQWLDTGLSKTLVSRDMLARDPAADERAFYECATDRDCAQRLLALYMLRRARDCDRDGRLDCYDVAAVHQAGPQACNAEPLTDSQYWSDFNACFGFGARRRRRHAQPRAAPRLQR